PRDQPRPDRSPVHPAQCPVRAAHRDRDPGGLHVGRRLPGGAGVQPPGPGADRPHRGSPERLPGGPGRGAVHDAGLSAGEPSGRPDPDAAGRSGGGGVSIAGAERLEAEGMPPSVVQPPASVRATGKRSLPRRVVRALPVAWVVVVVLGGLFGHVVYRRPPTATTLDILLGPGIHHLMGTDELGRDVLSRVMSGASTSVRVAGFAVLIALLTGSPWST